MKNFNQLAIDKFSFASVQAFLDSQTSLSKQSSAAFYSTYHVVLYYIILINTYWLIYVEFERTIDTRNWLETLKRQPVMCVMSWNETGKLATIEEALPDVQEVLLVLRTLKQLYICSLCCEPSICNVNCAHPCLSKDSLQKSFKQKLLTAITKNTHSLRNNRKSPLTFPSAEHPVFLHYSPWQIIPCL